MSTSQSEALQCPRVAAIVTQSMSLYVADVRHKRNDQRHSNIHIQRQLGIVEHTNHCECSVCGRDMGLGMQERCMQAVVHTSTVAKVNLKLAERNQSRASTSAPPLIPTAQTPTSLCFDDISSRHHCHHTYSDTRIWPIHPDKSTAHRHWSCCRAVLSVVSGYQKRIHARNIPPN